MNEIKWVIDGIFVGIELYILLLYFGHFFEKRPCQPIVKILYIALVGGLLWIPPHFLSAAPPAPVVFCLITFLISLLFTGKLLTRTLLSLLGAVIFIASDMMTGMWMSAILGLDISKIQQDIILYFFACAVAHILAFIIVMIIKIKARRQRYISLGGILPLLVPPAAILIVLHMVYLLAYEVSDLQIILLTITGILLLLFGNLTMFYITERQSETEIKNRQFENQIKHYERVYNYLREIHKIRHDLKQDVITIKGYLQEGKIREAQNCLDSINGEIQSAQSLIETGITALDILINAKHEIAKAEKIGFSCDIRLNPDIPIDIMDIVRVLGNALDNAIEACSKVENRNRAVFLCILESKSQLIITIENTSGHYEQNESDGPHQTSKIHKLKHGFGLKTIEKIAKEYGGYISTDFSNGQFTLSVFMWKSRKPE